MAELKNQHFVPKVHLRAFSDDDGPEKRMINMVHVESEKAIRGASISGQCSKSYFYGKDLRIEKALGPWESTYGRTVKQVEEGSANDSIVKSLRTWVYFQYMRTDSARKRFHDLHIQLNNAIGDKDWQIHPTHEELIKEAIEAFFGTLPVIEDLKSVIIDNCSSLDFVTSDAPAVVFNKWLSQKRKLHNFGLSNSGVCLFMPLTPRVAFISYDAQVYDVSLKGKYRTRLSDRGDIDLLNALLLRADATSIYFRQWSDKERLLVQVKGEKPHRTKSSRTSILVPTDDEGTTFRALRDDEDGSNFPRSMLHTESVFPKPPQWFKFLRNKIRPIYYENGTAVGCVRKREWLNGFAFEQGAPPTNPPQHALPGLPVNSRRSHVTWR